MAIKSYLAGADLTGKLGFAVKSSGTSKTVIVGTANAVCIGILTNDNTSGKAVGVALDGEVCLAKLGGSVSYGDFLKADSAGKLVVAGGTGDDNVIAQALQGGSANDLAEVVIVKFVK